jgi:ornithine cyclodeaminase
MTLRVISGGDVDDLLSMPECIVAVEAAFVALADDDAVQPLRPIMRLPDRGLIGMMPGFLGNLGEAGVAGVKAISVFGSNHGTEFDSHQGAVMLFEGRHGRLFAVVDASSITATRTAAASAVATRALAPPEASTLAMIGSGTQARSHLEAMVAVRPITTTRVWSRSTEAAHSFAEWADRALGIVVGVAASPAEAVAGADVICTTTASADPLVSGPMLEPGMHINAVGACTPNARELDTAAVAMSELFVDRRQSALTESGELIIACNEGAITESHIVAEIGDVITGRHGGRSSETAITVFDSLGLAVQDIAAAHLVYERAVQLGRGVEIDFGG